MDTFVGYDLSKTINTIWDLLGRMPWQTLSTLKPLDEQMQGGVGVVKPSSQSEIDFTQHFFWLGAISASGRRLCIVNPRNGSTSRRSEMMLGRHARPRGFPERLTERGLVVSRDGSILLLTINWKKKDSRHTAKGYRFVWDHSELELVPNAEELIDLCLQDEEHFGLSNFQREAQATILWALEKTRRDRVVTYEACIRAKDETANMASGEHTKIVLLQQDAKKVLLT